MKPSSPTRAPNSAAATAASTRTPKSPSRRKTISSCGASPSPTPRARARPSKSPATRRWCWPRRPPTRCIRRSATCSCRPRFCAQQAGDSLHAPAALPRRASAVDVPPDGGAWGGGRRGLLRDRPHALHRPRQHRGQSAGDGRARRRSPTATARCSIRLSRSAGRSRSMAASRSRSIL